MIPKLNLQTLYFPKRLIHEIENIKNYPLTVLEAPSGFGKTTALSEFLSRLSAENTTIIKHSFFTDNAAEYWRIFCEALSHADPISAAALSGCGAPCADNMSDIHDIMCGAECPNETYIVLDNLSGAAENIDLFLAALEFSTAENLHIIASIQSAAEGGRAALRGSRTHCIGTADLAFSEADCRAYFAAAGIHLTDAEVRELMHATGGWVFAVYLQLLFYAKNARFEKGILSRVLQKAFWDRLSDGERRFYISLTPFNRFTVRLAAEVGGCTADIARARLDGCGFVHYDGEKEQYYFHNLLSAYLGEVFAQLDPSTQNRILISAAEWEENHGGKVRANYLYYRAGDFERIFSMPHTSYDLADIEDRGTRQMIFDILDKTPRETKLRHIENMVPLAFILFFLGENEKLGETIGEIYELLGESSLSDKEKNALLGETELLLSFTEYNDIAAMSRRHRRACELLGGRASLINLRSTWTFGSPSVMLLYHKETGGLDEELRQMDECMPIYYRLTGGHGSGAEFAMRAEAEFMRGNLCAAETLAHRAIFSARSKNQPSVVRCGLFTLACIAVQRGDSAMLSDTIVSLSETADSDPEDMCRHTQKLILGCIYAFTHRIEKIADWLADGRFDESTFAPMTLPFANIIYAKTLLERKEYSKLLALCRFAADTAFPSVLPQIYFHIFACCAHSALADDIAAERELSAALSLALPDRIYMPFAQNFPEIRQVLKRTAADRGGYTEILRLGEEFEKAAARLGSEKPKLSPRESEVAELIRQGLTNKQIAARLYISLSTVKITISSIFEKTGIRSRVQLTEIE